MSIKSRLNDIFIENKNSYENFPFMLTRFHHHQQKRNKKSNELEEEQEFGIWPIEKIKIIYLMLSFLNVLHILYFQ